MPCHPLLMDPQNIHIHLDFKQIAQPGSTCLPLLTLPETMLAPFTLHRLQAPIHSLPYAMQAKVIHKKRNGLLRTSKPLLKTVLKSGIPLSIHPRCRLRHRGLGDSQRRGTSRLDIYMSPGRLGLGICLIITIIVVEAVVAVLECVIFVTVHAVEMVRRCVAHLIFPVA